MIDARNINVKFGKRQILKDLNFKVNKGEYIYYRKIRSR